MLQMSIARSGTTDLGVAPRRHVSPYRLACPLSLIPENFEQAIKAEWMKKEMSRLSHGSPRQRIANDIARVLRRECSVSCKVRVPCRVARLLACRDNVCSPPQFISELLLRTSCLYTWHRLAIG